jgi:hypothetical protein
MKVTPRSAQSSANGLAEQDRLVGGAHERRPALGLGVQCDDTSTGAVLRVEFAHGADEPHGGFSAVDDGDTTEHACTSPW